MASMLRTAPLASTSGRSAAPAVRYAPAAAKRVAVRASTTSFADYAVISTPAGKQLVEEGMWFPLCSVAAAQASSDGQRLRFPAVAVKRADGEFVKGPRAANWVVEAELIDEEAWALQTASGKNSALPLGKVLVTKIVHTEETRRKLEEALGQQLPQEEVTLV
ncbi:hypothetical protein HYH03_003223 [Edaphochlamys debaryana]|uniref:Uncharacterized protein n=1 Tax=Edaphochlamys debaryana TaxID=47281 RepID=A0A835YAE0_9CHLO|nr:hypothetical protein HYH03_003223 [Edaphochlamys debaryana]|eukprot:KAG2499038.1 hypothetical protein HYH03_003223 [Edaphochlamys debaryana]